MKKALLALLLVAAALVAAQYLIYLPMEKQRLAESAAKWEAKLEAERAAASAQEAARIYAKALAELEQEKRHSEEMARIKKQHEDELAAIEEDRFQQLVAEQELLLQAEARARASAVQQSRRYYSNPASAENLRAQGVNPRFFGQGAKAPRTTQIIETAPGHFIVVPE